jgi:hypothetical protein
MRREATAPGDWSIRVNIALYVQWFIPVARIVSLFIPVSICSSVSVSTVRQDGIVSRQRRGGSVVDGRHGRREKGESSVYSSSVHWLKERSMRSMPRHSRLPIG